MLIAATTNLSSRLEKPSQQSLLVLDRYKVSEPIRFSPAGGQELPTGRDRLSMESQIRLILKMYAKVGHAEVLLVPDQDLPLEPGGWYEPTTEMVLST